MVRTVRAEVSKHEPAVVFALRYLRANGESPVERYLVLGSGHGIFRVALLMDYGVAGPFGFSTAGRGLGGEAFRASARVSVPAAEAMMSWDFLMGQ
jgi:hypothetical protein